MNPTDGYEYLWNGSEPGWVLLSSNQQALALSATFSRESPDAHNAKILREAVPFYKGLSASETIASVREKPTLNLGEYGLEEGRRIAEICRKGGITVSESVVDRIGYLFFNEETKMALVIEDDALAPKIWEEALRRGLPIKSIETCS